MRWRALLVGLVVAGCEPEKPVRAPTGIIHTPEDREANRRAALEGQRQLDRETAAAEAAAQRAAEAKKAVERAAAAEKAAQAERERAAVDAYSAGVRRKLQCAKDRAWRATRHTTIDAVAASDTARAARLTAVEKWIKARCRRLGQKVTHPEVQVAKDGTLIRKEVIVDLIPFWACPANTPDDIIRDGNLSDSELYGWHRFDDRAPTIPVVTPAIVKAEHDSVDETQKPECKDLDAAAQTAQAE